MDTQLQLHEQLPLTFFLIQLKSTGTKHC